MAGFDNQTMFADNVDFRGVKPIVGQMTTDGQLLIGSTASPHIKAGSLGSSDSSITWTAGSGTLTAQVSGGTTVLKTLTGNTGGALSPTAGNINITGTGSITVAGAGSTLTPQLTGLTNHAIQIGAGTATLTQLAATATTGQVLQNNSGADPSYSTATYPATTTINQLLYSNAANTVSGLTAANSSHLVSTSAGVPLWTSSMTNGQVVLGSTGATPVTGTIGSSDSSITWTLGAGTLTAQVTGGTTVLKTLTGNTGGALSPTAGNINITGTGSITVSGAGSTLTPQLTGLTNHAVQVGAGTATLTQIAATATTGAILQNNSGADPSYSTASYPSTAGTSGKILISDGTNIVSSTPTYPNASVTAGKVIISDGTNYVASTPTFPNASATSGKFIRSDGTNWIASTPTLPTTAGTSGNVLTSDGTNFVNTTTRIQTINGDSGSITGTTVTTTTGNSTQANGATFKFTNSSATSTLSVTDANDNILLGRVAGNGTYSGLNNVGIGAGCFQQLTSGTDNAAYGYTSQGNLTTGVQNASLGRASLNQLQTGNGNCALGYEALKLSTSATGQNSAVGWRCLNQLVGGSTNTALGISSGTNYTGSESSNIVIQNAGTLGESNTLRIGTQGSGSGQVSTCYIAGITGVTVANQNLVTLNSSTGQLGVSSATGILAWTDVTSATQALSVSNGYVTDRGAGVTYTLPATAVLGDTINIVGKLGTTVITPNANQQILIGSISGTVGVTGTATGTNVGDCIQLRCITGGSSTVWRAEGYVGTWVLA